MNDRPARVRGVIDAVTGAPPSRLAEVGLDNWMSPPFNAWSFQHMSEVVSTARIPASASVVATDAGGCLGELSFAVGEGSITLAEWICSSHTDAVAVMSDGQFHYVQYPHSAPQALHLCMSVSKSIVSMIIGTLVDDGMLNTEVSITDYLPELGSTGFRGATVQHALDMTVSLDYQEDYEDSSAEFWRMDVASGWAAKPAGVQAAGSLWEFLLSLGAVDAPHGEQFSYCSINVDVVGLICERLSGTPFPELISDRLWIPAQLASEGSLAVDPAGASVVDGGLSATLTDYVRLAQLMVDGRSESGAPVLSTTWLDDCWRLQRRAGDGVGRAVYIPWLDAEYSYHNWWYGADDGTLRAYGTHGQVVVIDRASRIVVVWLSSWPAHSVSHLRSGQENAITAVLEAIRKT